MADLIPLSEIDALAVLSGARVPLVPWHGSSYRRLDWCVDCATPIGSALRGAEYDVCALGQLGAAIDPSDPDVARVLDRRIAEARGYQGVVVAVLYIESGRFRLLVVTSEPRADMPGISDHPAIKDIEPIPANIPTARVALIRALYPRKDA